jgi:hypothetical protein
VNVKLFAWLYAASCVIPLVEAFVMPPPAVGSKISYSTELVITIGGAIILELIFLPFFWLAVWRQKNWARWLSVVSFVITLPMSFVPLPPELLPMMKVAIGGALIQAIAFYFVFTGDARPWFAAKNSN